MKKNNIIFMLCLFFSPINTLMKLKHLTSKTISLILCCSLIASLFTGQLSTINALTPVLDKELADYSDNVNMYHFYQFNNSDTDWSDGYWGKQGISYTPLWMYNYEKTGKENELVNGEYFRTTSGQVAYCLNFGKKEPSALVSPGSNVSTELKRVLVNGYPVKTGKDYNISDIELEWATGIALKIVEGNGYDKETGDIVPGSGFKLDYFYNDVLEYLYTSKNYPGIPDEEVQKYTTAANTVRDVVKTLVEYASDESVVFDSLSLSGNNTEASINNKTKEFSLGPFKVSSTVNNLKYELAVKEGYTLPENIKIVNESNEELSSLNNDQLFYIKGTSTENSDFSLEVYSDTTAVYPDVCFSPVAVNEQDMYIVAPLKLYETMDLSIKKDVKILKIDSKSKEPVKNVSITVKDSMNETVYTGTTDNDGYLTIPKLSAGTYSYKENGIATGYIKNDTEYQFTVDSLGSVVGTISFSNTPTELTLTKYDTKTGTALANAAFSIISLDGETQKVVASGTTNADGEFSVSRLPVGNYKFLETSAPNGYSRVDNYFNFTIGEDGVVTGQTSIGNIPNKVTITKTDSENNDPVSGAEFLVEGVSNDFSQSFTTNDKGSFSIEYIPSGTYTYKETKAPSGYILSTDIYTFTVEENGSIKGTVSIKDTPVSRNVIVKKVDAETKELLSDAAFSVYEWNKENNDYSKNEYSKLTNNEDGTYKTTLKYSQSNEGKFKLVETNAPKDYLYEDIVKEINILPYEDKNIDITVENKKNVKEILAEVQWLDNDNAYNTRPASVIVSLDNNDGNVIQQVNAENYKYNYDFKDLVIYKNTTNKYNYTVSAENKLSANNGDSYSLVSIEKDKNSSTEKYIITYRLEGKININGSIIWDDSNNKDGIRPANVKVSLSRENSNTVGSKEDLTFCNESVSFDFGSFDKYNDDGIKYNYFISQNDVEFYNTSYRDNIVVYSTTPFIYTQNNDFEIVNNHVSTEAIKESSLTINFNNIFVKNGEIAKDEDFDKVALNNKNDYLFTVTLTNVATGKEYNGILNSNKELTFSSLPINEDETKYKVVVQGNEYFNFNSLELNNTFKDMDLSFDGTNYYLTLASSEPKDFVTSVNTKMQIVDWRGYSSLDNTNTQSYDVTPITDFEYVIDNNSVVINKYIGNNDRIIISPEYTINNITYDTILATADTKKNIFGNTSVKYIVFEDGVSFEENNAQYAFANSSVKKVINLPNSINNMNYAFMNATNLTEISNIPSNTETMKSCFEGCSQLQNIPSFAGLNKLTNIESLFKDCPNISKAPDLTNCVAITKIDNAFNNCSELKGYIRIGSKDIDSANNVFNKTEHIITVYLPAKTTSCDTVKEATKNINNIVINTL